MPRYSDGLAVTVKLRPDISRTGFLRRCYDEWVADAAYYREHPEIDCPPDYLRIPPFDRYVAEIARDRVAELQSMMGVRDGFKIEVVRV